MPTVIVPLTVAPAAGLVIEADSGVGPFCTTIAALLLPVLPVASRALTVSVCDPLATCVVSHGIEIGPVLLVVVDATFWAPTLSVYVFDVPLEPPSQSTTQLVPLTVVPLLGWVMKTCRVPLETVTGFVAVAETLAASVTVSR